MEPGRNLHLQRSLTSVFKMSIFTSTGKCSFYLHQRTFLPPNKEVTTEIYIWLKWRKRVKKLIPNQYIYNITTAKAQRIPQKRVQKDSNSLRRSSISYNTYTCTHTPFIYDREQQGTAPTKP